MRSMVDILELVVVCGGRRLRWRIKGRDEVVS